MRIEKLADGMRIIHFKHMHFAYRVYEKSQFYVKTYRGFGIFIVCCSIHKLELGIGVS